MGLFLDPTKLLEKSNFVIFSFFIVKEPIGILQMFPWLMWLGFGGSTAHLLSLPVGSTLNYFLDCPLHFSGGNEPQFPRAVTSSVAHPLQMTSSLSLSHFLNPFSGFPRITSQIHDLHPDLFFRAYCWGSSP